MGNRAIFTVLFCIFVGQIWAQDETSDLQSSRPRAHRTAFVNPSPQGWYAFGQGTATAAELIVGVPTVWRTAKVSVREGWRLTFKGDERKLLKQAAEATTRAVRETAELRALEKAQNDYLQALSHPTSSESLAMQQEKLRELEAEIEKDLKKAKGKSVYMEADLKEVKSRRLGNAFVKPIQDADHLIRLHELRTELEKRQIAALAIGDERRNIADEMIQRFKSRARLITQTDSAALAKGLAGLKADRAIMYDDLQSAKPLYSPEELRRIDKQILDMEFSSQAFPDSKRAVAEAADELAAQSSNFVTNPKNHPKWSAKTKSFIAKNGLKILWWAGTLVAAYDAAGRLYVWNILDADPTLSPVYTGGWLWWKDEIALPDAIDNPPSLPRDGDELLVPEKPGEKKNH